MSLNFLADLIFPPRCLNCGAAVGSGRAVCDACFASIPVNASFFCGRCGARLPTATRTCHPDFPYLLGAAARYENEAVRRLIRGLKFQFVKDAALPLAELLVGYAEKLPLRLASFVTIPVPLGVSRERQRGFNQARLIAEAFADHFAIPLLSGCLVRSRNTAPQSELDFSERASNVKGCFAVTDAAPVHKRDVFLVDDVTTSGATFLEAAQALRAAGAKKIIALAAAKA